MFHVDLCVQISLPPPALSEGHEHKYQDVHTHFLSSKYLSAGGGGDACGKYQSADCETRALEVSFY